MNITAINFNSNAYGRNNVNFKRYHGRQNSYQVAVTDMELPKHQSVYVQNDAVLALSPDGRNFSKSCIIGLDGKPVKSAFQRGRTDVISIGTSGDLTIPYRGNESVSRHHLELRKQGDGYLVKDVSDSSTKLTPFHDYTDKPEGTEIGKLAMINKDAKLILGNNYELDFNSSAIYNQIKPLEYGRWYTIGNSGDIRTNHSRRHVYDVDEQHLKFLKLKDYYVVSNISKNNAFIADSGSSPRFSYKYPEHRNAHQTPFYGEITQTSKCDRILNSIQSDYPEICDQCREDLIKFVQSLKNLDIENLTSEEKEALRDEFNRFTRKYHPDLTNKSGNNYPAVQQVFQGLGLVDNHYHWKD